MIDQFEGKVVAEKYRIDSLMRESESGDLYFARHISMDKPVMLRILAPALAIDFRYIKRFSDEARVASTVTHQNILNVTDFGTDANNVEYAVYEGADGETLKDALRRDGPFSVERALRLAKQIAGALAAGHAKKVVHGQLDPQNIFLNKGDDLAESAKVFGIGIVAAEKNLNPQYRAPEHGLRPPIADERSDIYSLGVVLFQMLAGEPPFAGSTSTEILSKQNNELPPPLVAFRQDLPDDLEPMILSAMSKDPERRYQTMSAFAQDLDLVSIGIAAPVKVAAAAAVAAVPKRNLWQTAFLVLAGILLLGGALIYSTSVKQTNPTTELQADAGSLPVQPINPATGAQEESLSKLPAMTDAEIMATASNSATTPAGTLPGGDGFNAWANGGAPPAGAPLPNFVPPSGGQTYTIDPNGGSQFMPPDGIILVPVPANTNTAAKPLPTPKSANVNANVGTTVVPKPTPKPMATPPVTAPTPAKTKPATKPPANKPEDEIKQ